jgi:hypothetical protein
VMLRLDRFVAEELGRHLAAEFRRTFGSQQEPLAEVLEGTARLAIECIAQSDALYHNFEHTLLVGLVGQDILRGRLLRENLLPGDWLHFMIACLMHDIGYVGGLLDEDIDRTCVSDGQGRIVTLPRGASDAALSPYHVDRSKLFVMRRFSGLEQIDATRIARMIEFTRFPSPDGQNDTESDKETGLVRAADLIGQLGDPHYLRKTNALYREFEETGINLRLGFTSPADIVERYPMFFWDQVAKKITPAVKHLEVTVEGRTWLAHLHANVFRAEQEETS